MGRAAAALRAIVVLATLALAGAGLQLGPVGHARAASPVPGDSAVSMNAEAMLGGRFRPSSWAAIRVTLQNDGPAVDGELRLSTAASGSTYSRAVQLPTGARQEHVLYGQTAALTTRFKIDLTSGQTVHASVNVPVEPADVRSLGVFLAAERPQVLVEPVRDALTGAGQQLPSLTAIQPEDLPPRVEAWSAVDLLVWHDADSNRLDGERIEALRTWVSMGGNLVILAGSTGSATLGAFPAELMPYRPTGMTAVPVADLEALLGGAAVSATSVPALAGPLQHGVALASSGAEAIAARATYGQGTVALSGIDPTTPELADSTADEALWARVLPSQRAPRDRFVTGDAYLINALGNLPVVALPRLEHIFLLIIAYIVAIGPLNYILLRRRDRREWAWLTMPATIVLFGVVTFGFGLALKGGNIVVNELTVLRSSAGADRALATVYVGVFSPGRATFDVKVGGDVLVSAPTMGQFGEAPERPVSVLLGDPATVRDYGVGFGALRGFRAEAAVAVPRIDADLRFVGGRLEGTVANASSVTVEDVTIVNGTSLDRIGDLRPGESRAIELPTSGSGFADDSLARRLFPQAGGDDADAVRTSAARRALVQHLSGGWDDFGGEFRQGILSSGPVIIGWLPGPAFEVDVGSPAQRVGERVLVIPVLATVSGPITFSGNAIRPSIVSAEGLEGTDERGSFYMAPGLVVADYRPAGFEGTFEVSSMTIRFGAAGRIVAPAAIGDDLAPLPPAEQPDQQDPLASDPRPGEGVQPPRLQLFDRVGGEWVEFEPMVTAKTYRVPDPARYVDEGGAFRVRFLVRGGDYVEFSFGARLEGHAE